MRRLAIVLLILLLAAPVSFAGVRHKHHDLQVHSLTSWEVDGVRYEFDRGDLVISCDRRDFESIVITRDYELIVNDEEIPLDSAQQKLVQEYYDTTKEIITKAKKIGWEGARIGLKGVGLAFEAVHGVLKMIFTSYDEDDLDRDMELAAAKLEAKAERLEDEAEEIEDLVELLEELADEMADEIPAVGDLRWFPY